MALRSSLSARPLATAVIFEGGLVPLALVLALLTGLEPWRAFRLSAEVLLAGVLATVPLVAGLAVLGAAGSAWFREIERLVRPLIEWVFRGRGALVVIGVSALAGLGEELLFRGVIQAWLVAGTGAWAGLILASIVFGLVHALSWAYFVMATAIGLYLGLLYQWTGNLLLPVLAHALYDAIAIGYLLCSGGAPAETASNP